MLRWLHEKRYINLAKISHTQNVVSTIHCVVTTLFVVFEGDT